MFCSVGDRILIRRVIAYYIRGACNLLRRGLNFTPWVCRAVLMSCHAELVVGWFSGLICLAEVLGDLLDWEESA